MFEVFRLQINRALEKEEVWARSCGDDALQTWETGMRQGLPRQSWVMVSSGDGRSSFHLTWHENVLGESGEARGDGSAAEAGGKTCRLNVPSAI